MAYSEGLANRIRTTLSRRRGTGERQMFGGVCFTMNGHMVCGVVKDDLMVRVGPNAYQKSLRRAHARPMDFTGRQMVGFVYVAAAGLKSAASLKSWIGAGIAYANTLPPKALGGSEGAQGEAHEEKIPRATCRLSVPGWRAIGPTHRGCLQVLLCHFRGREFEHHVILDPELNRAKRTAGQLNRTPPFAFRQRQNLRLGAINRYGGYA